MISSTRVVISDLFQSLLDFIAGGLIEVAVAVVGVVVISANAPGKLAGESHYSVENAPAQDHGVVDVPEEAGKEHAVAEPLEGGHHSAVELEHFKSGLEC